MERIAVLTSYFPVKEEPHRGQSAYQTLRLMKNAVDLKAFVPLPKYLPGFSPRSFPYVRHDLTYNETEVTAYYFEYLAAPFISRITNGLSCGSGAKSEVRRFRPDLILNFRAYPEGYGAVTLGKALRLPVVLMSLGSDLNAIADPITRYLTRRGLLGADMVLSVSEHLRTQAIRMGVPGNKARAIHNGCDTAIFRQLDRNRVRYELGLNATSKFLLFVGRLDVRKGLRELVRAFAKIRNVHPDLELVIVGDGIAKPELQDLAIECNVSSGIRWISSVASSEVAKWMNASELVTLPSYSEGCPNVVLEASNCGVPVVATDVGGIPELVDDVNGVLVSPRDVESLAAGLLAALQRQWDRKQIALSRKRNWQDVATEMLNVCEEVVARRKKHAGAPDWRAENADAERIRC